MPGAVGEPEAEPTAARAPIQGGFDAGAEGDRVEVGQSGDVDRANDLVVGHVFIGNDFPPAVHIVGGPTAINAGSMASMLPSPAAAHRPRPRTALGDADLGHHRVVGVGVVRNPGQVRLIAA